MDEKRILAIRILNAVEDYLHANKDDLFEKHVSNNKNIITGEGYYKLEDEIVKLINEE